VGDRLEPSLTLRKTGRRNRLSFQLQEGHPPAQIMNLQAEQTATAGAASNQALQESKALRGRRYRAPALSPSGGASVVMRPPAGHSPAAFAVRPGAPWGAMSAHGTPHPGIGAPWSPWRSMDAMPSGGPRRPSSDRDFGAMVRRPAPNRPGRPDSREVIHRLILIRYVPEAGP
jgi:hypothetical protein